MVQMVLPADPNQTTLRSSFTSIKMARLVLRDSTREWHDSHRFDSVSGDSKPGKYRSKGRTGEASWHLPNGL